MTEKQEKILHAALELFARDGFSSTSTSKVATYAGVSEGLIFRHFKNKEGLLKAILQEGEEKARTLFADIVLESDPKEVIRKTIDMVLHISTSRSDLEFWKLQYKIKWETEKYGEHKIEPLHLALTNAFSKLGYESPDLEASLLLIINDGLATRIALQQGFDCETLTSFLKKKYNI
jgi:AcrR family transcriptional regulator